LIQEEEFNKARSEKEVIKHIEDGRLYYMNQKKITDTAQAINLMLSATALLVFDDEKTAFSIDAKGFEKRSITEPSVENVIKGAKDAFIEVIRINTALCRRKIKSHNLVIEEIKAGEQTNTPIAIIYMNNIANKDIVKKVKEKLCQINVDRITSSGYIEEFIFDRGLCGSIWHII
jgi:spore germination protein KA